MKYVCTVCGYVYEGDSLPADFVCPVCKAPADKFLAQGDGKVWAAEHVVGVAKGVSDDILEDLRANFNGYILRLVGKILYGTCTNKHHLELTDATWDERVAVICLIVCVAGLGMAPFWVSHMIGESVLPVVSQLIP